MGNVRLAELRRRFNPARCFWQDDTAGPLSKELRMVHAWRSGALFRQGSGGVEQTPPGADDHGVAASQMLLCPIVDGTHGLGDCLILGVDASDARVITAFHALPLTVDAVVVGDI